MCRRRSNFPEQEKRGQRTRGEHLARVKHWARDFPRAASCAPIREADAITTPAEYEETEAQGGHAAPNGTPKSIYCLRLPPLPHPSVGGVGTTVLPISPCCSRTPGLSRGREMGLPGMQQGTLSLFL